MDSLTFITAILATMKNKINTLIWNMPQWVHEIIFKITGWVLFRIRSALPIEDHDGTVTTRFEWGKR